VTTSEIKKRLANLPEPEWIRKMKEHYARTGTYRPEDLRRLLGDPARRVEMPPQGSVTKHFSV
jgi:hypothetical protein